MYYWYDENEYIQKRRIIKIHSKESIVLVLVCTCGKEH